MQDRHKIHIALPRRPAIRSALENALRAASSLHLGKYDLTDKIDDAEVVVTDSETQSNEIGRLPDSVRYLQLIDCGSGTPNMTGDDLTVANASSLLVHDPADWAIDQWREIARRSSRTRQKGPNVAGIIGFGSLGYELGKQLNELGSENLGERYSDTKADVIPERWGAPILARHAHVSTSDIIFVAVHHGPTSDPLLSRRELHLLELGATIINMSGEKVVDHGAIKTLNEYQERNIDYREMPSDLASASASRRPQSRNQLGSRQPRQLRTQPPTPLHSRTRNPPQSRRSRILGIQNAPKADAGLRCDPSSTLNAAQPEHHALAE